MDRRTTLFLSTCVVVCTIVAYATNPSDGTAPRGWAGSHPGLRGHVQRLLTLLDEEEEIPSLYPILAKDCVGFVVATLALMLAAGGGIGGGGILVPIYILILDFPVKHAIPLVSATVLGGAVANNLLNARREHPNHSTRTCVDWDLLLQLEPMTMAGALIGADCNEVLPDIVLVLLLLILLTAIAYKTIQKAHVLHTKETLEIEKASGGTSETTPIYQQNGSATLPADDAFEATHPAPVVDVLKLVGLFVFVTCINLIKGGPTVGGGPLGLTQCGSWCFWLSKVALLALLLLFSIHMRQQLLRRVELGSIQSDISWDAQNTVLYPSYAIVAGLAAGLFGVGGGIIKGPLMLSLGVHPAVASATSACMILFTSSTATVSYAVFGNLIYDYALAGAGLGFVATAAGQTLMRMLLERFHQRHSYIAYSIGFVVALSAVCMTIESVLAIM